VWNGIVQAPKTANGLREIDVHPSLAALLKDYIADRESGFLFQNTSGKPFSQTNALKRGLHPILESMEREKCGFHSFRSYRVTHLRKNRVPEDLLRFWIGHADKSVTDHYSKMKEDAEFRQLCPENIGLGFELPSVNPIEKCELAPSCTQNDLVLQSV
jgi:integrase